MKIAIIEPGYFRTSMTDTPKNLEVLEQQWMKVPEEIKESYGQAYFDACESLYGLQANWGNLTRSQKLGGAVAQLQWHPSYG